MKPKNKTTTKKPKLSESDIQMQIVAYLRARGVMHFSVPNELLGRSNTPAGMARMMRFRNMGLTSGVSDLILLLPGARSVFLELKTASGKQSETQALFQRRAESLGFIYHIARSLGEAQEITEKLLNERNYKQ